MPNTATEENGMEAATATSTENRGERPLQVSRALRPLPAYGPETLFPARHLPGELPKVVDCWVLLAVLWASRLATGGLDPGVALFGVIVFATVVPAAPGRDRLGGGALDGAGHVFKWVWLAYAAVSALGFLIGIGHPGTQLAAAVALGPALLAGRAVSHRVERLWRARGAKAPTLIVGGGDIARRLIANLQKHPEYGLEVVGVADDDPKFDSGQLGARILGGTGDVPHIIGSRDVEVVIVAFGSTNQADLIDVIRSAMTTGANVWVVPRLFELSSAGRHGDHIWGVPVVRLQPPARSRPAWVLKRAVDLAFAGLGVVVLSPLFAAIAAATYLDSGRPILLRQRRLGLDGRGFDMLKFRTMRPADWETENTEWVPDEERVTRVGRVLRGMNLDELPQLFNVLRGEMSLVGPRPERPHFVELFSDMYPSYNARHRLPAGVTGWSQIHGLRGDTSIEERATFDNHYIENWSLSSDLKILIKTVPALVKDGGGDSNGHKDG